MELVVFYTWKENNLLEPVINKILKVIEDNAKTKLDSLVLDLSTHTISDHKAIKSFVFGNIAMMQSGLHKSALIQLPQAKNIISGGNKKDRIKAFEIFKETGKDIRNILQAEKDKGKLYIETNNITIGQEKNIDISIDPTELEYLVKLKALLNDGEIVLEKNNKKIIISGEEYDTSR